MGVDFLTAISLGELALIYAIPIALFLAVCLSTSFVVMLIVRSRADFALKQDVLRKYEAKKRLRSGAKLRLSFRYVTQLVLGDNCIQAVVLYRLSRFLLLRRMRFPAQLVYAFSKFLTQIDISPWAKIGPGLYVYHGLGTVLGKGCRIGSNALICQGVAVAGVATLGDDVIVRAGAKVIGKVTLGDRCEIGVNAVVINDVPPDAIMFGIPARQAGKREGAAPAEVESAA